MKKAKKRGLTTKNVKVTVKTNSVTLSGLKVSHKKKAEQVGWTCKGGKLDVKFTNGSPYPTSTFSTSKSGETTYSGECKTSLPPGSIEYEYTLVVHPTGKADITIDPQVEVNDPGHPGQFDMVARHAGSKKQAKKK